ncbi:MAG TPA: 3-deoxy-7-phosphoheptulonate synthase [Anaerolineae bacterium]|nr:3-deoxy-7-phosphoheptulonate synthase [Anaerolineae bacterium]HID85522.1 3-deoxy-7-phosphoheptulonate synthase [Anaerolineales bacterium]HIQ09699.1 3-deoxy-7-phosphoheptulonate synthase [Anaerolineaceae bacterium]
MMVLMHAQAKDEEIAAVLHCARRHGLRPHLSRGAERVVIGLIGDTRTVNPAAFLRLSGVADVVRLSRPYKLASREFHPNPSQVQVGPVTLGGPEVVFIAGPCSVESRSQLLETAHAVKESGAHLLRGGAFKPRTSPYSFQGLGERGLELLAEAREVTGLPVVTEVLSPEQVPLVARYADMLQIGARNMQNFPLLRAAGQSGKPVLLKRGMSATLDEFLLAAEYILSAGNDQVALCERGIRTFEQTTRNTTDINAIPALKQRTHLPVLLDPSHSTGHWQYVGPVALAGVAAGADGLIVEVHPHPEEALSDGAQSLKPERFAALVRQAQAVALAVGRAVAAPVEVRP